MYFVNKRQVAMPSAGDRINMCQSFSLSHLDQGSPPNEVTYLSVPLRNSNLTLLFAFSSGKSLSFTSERVYLCKPTTTHWLTCMFHQCWAGNSAVNWCLNDGSVSRTSTAHRRHTPSAPGAYLKHPGCRELRKHLS